MRRRIKIAVSMLIACCFSNFTFAFDLNFSGFATFGGAFTDDDPNPNDDDQFELYDLDKDITFDLDSKFAIQAMATINDKVSATTQFLSKGRAASDYEAETEWAFINYEATSDVALRIGRMRVPFFNYSDYLDVGYAYHWIRPPTEVYRLAFNTYEGGDMRVNAVFGDIDGSLQFYYGRVTNDDPFPLPNGLVVESTGEHLTGIVGSANWEWLSLRASAHRANLSIVSPRLEAALQVIQAAVNATGAPQKLVDQLVQEKDDIKFFEIALSADFEHLFVQTEVTRLDFSETVLADANAWFVTGGYRFGDLTLHGTYGKLNFEADLDLIDQYLVLANPFAIGAAALAIRSQDTKRESTTIGIRWDFLPGVDFKLEAQQIDFTSQSSIEDEAMIYSFVVDTVF